MIKILSEYKPRIYHYLVYWKPPERGTIKCNTDSVSKGNPGMSAYGIYFRNWEGDLIYAQVAQLGFVTNMEAKAKAIKVTVRVSIERKWQDITIEIDLRTLMNIILGKWKSPWDLIEVVEEISNNMEALHAKTQHIFREGNQLADHLANWILAQASK